MRAAARVVRRHAGDGMRSRADYSACGGYRYMLERVWGDAGRLCLWVMLNPSTASERANDPTVLRCERRARATGFDGLQVVNLFAWRATDPRALREVADPVGPGADAVILRAAGTAAQVVCGWGRNGSLGGRGAAVEAALRRAGVGLWHLGLTRQGHPVHPLYVSYDITPQPWPTI